MTRASLALLVCVLTALPACDESADNLPAASTDRPASRIVTLAPHLAELVFEVEAGDKLVGVSAYTDYPDTAVNIPVIGDAFVVDRERLALLKPDMLLAWESGTPAHVVDRLREAGYRVEVIRTQDLEDIGVALERIGILTGNAEQGYAAAAAFRDAIRGLQRRFAAAPQISVFYQVSRRPLYTVNGEHYISELIDLCGGRNVFADIGDLAPMIDVEAVIDRNPEVMLAGADSQGDAFHDWDRWPEIAANRFGNRFFMPASVIGRATTRLTIAAEAVCGALQQARRNRDKVEVHANE